MHCHYLYANTSEAIGRPLEYLGHQEGHRAVSLLALGEFIHKFVEVYSKRVAQFLYNSI
jgi:hypothetical protein